MNRATTRTSGGRHRGAYYEAAEPLRAVRAELLRERLPIDAAGLFEAP